MLLDTNFGYKAEVAYWKEEASCLEAKCDELDRRYTESVGGFKRDLQKRLDDQRAKNVRLKAELAEKQGYILELVAKLAEAEKDAQRYRWLRNPRRSHNLVGHFIDNTGKAAHLEEFALERAIDASIADLREKP